MKTPIIEVATQTVLEKQVTVREYANYFDGYDENKHKILNMLSLEVSAYKIQLGLKPPKFVQQIDLIDNVWPVSILYSLI